MFDGSKRDNFWVELSRGLKNLGYEKNKIPLYYYQLTADTSPLKADKTGVSNKMYLQILPQKKYFLQIIANTASNGK